MRKQLIINRLANCRDTLDEPTIGGNPSLFTIVAIDFIAPISNQSVSRVLHRFADQGHPAGDGASHLGQEDCHHRVDGVEERSVLRHPTSETTNSLSVFGVRSIPWDFPWRWPVGFWRHSGSRASLHCEVRRCVPRAPSLTADPRPSRITRNSDRPRASDRTMVGT